MIGYGSVALTGIFYACVSLVISLAFGYQFHEVIAVVAFLNTLINHANTHNLYQLILEAANGRKHSKKSASENNASVDGQNEAP